MDLTNFRICLNLKEYSLTPIVFRQTFKYQFTSRTRKIKISRALPTPIVEDLDVLLILRCLPGEKWRAL